MSALPNERLPFISVIIPMLNEEKYIAKCVQSVINQDYPKDLVECLVVDGGSTDKSIEIVKGLAKKYSNIKLLGGLGVNCPTAINIGIKEAKGEIICKVDAHGYVALDFLKMGLKFLYQNKDIKCVGGPIRPVTETFISKVNALARTSVFGVGRGIYSLSWKEQFVDSVQCGIYRRDLFYEIGDFDEQLQFGEDEEINWRVRKAGWGIYFTPAIKFFYYPRDSIRRLFTQYYNYGNGRVKVIKKHLDFFRVKHIIPSTFIIILIGSIILLPFNILFLWFFLAITSFYVLSSLTFSALISKKEGWRYLWVLPISFACLHFGYGLGFLRGVFNLIRIGKPKT